jgi:hypothetical protein
LGLSAWSWEQSLRALDDGTLSTAAHEGKSGSQQSGADRAGMGLSSALACEGERVFMHLLIPVHICISLGTTIGLFYPSRTTLRAFLQGVSRSRSSVGDLTSVDDAYTSGGYQKQRSDEHNPTTGSAPLQRISYASNAHVPSIKLSACEATDIEKSQKADLA